MTTQEEEMGHWYLFIYFLPSWRWDEYRAKIIIVISSSGSKVIMLKRKDNMKTEHLITQMVFKNRALKFIYSSYMAQGSISISQVDFLWDYYILKGFHG